MLLVVPVHVHVKPESVAAFLSATLENAERSLEAQRAWMRAAKEERNTLALPAARLIPRPSCACSSKIYRTAGAPAAHKAQRARMRAAKEERKTPALSAARLIPRPSCACSSKATAHYQKWRDTVAEMMAEPRTSTQFANLFPNDGAF